MIWTEYGRKLLLPHLRYYVGICLKGLRKTTENLSDDTRPPGRDLNLGFSECEILGPTFGRILCVLVFSTPISSSAMSSLC